MHSSGVGADAQPCVTRAPWRPDAVRTGLRLSWWRRGFEFRWGCATVMSQDIPDRPNPRWGSGCCGFRGGGPGGGRVVAGGVAQDFAGGGVDDPDVEIDDDQDDGGSGVQGRRRPVGTGGNGRGE